MPKHANDFSVQLNLSPDFKASGQFNDAVAVMSNLIVRATTRWTLEESKLFLLAVSQIEQRDEKNWVKLNKKDVANMLGLSTTKTNELRALMTRMRNKSEIYFDGPSKEEWIDGYLLTMSRSDRNNLYIRFNDYYIPLLHYVAGQLFTRIDVKCIIGFQHRSTYNLYMYLASWHNANYAANNRKINKADLAKVFDLKEGQYWRNYGTDKAKFDWYKFEQKCVTPALEEIKANKNCDLCIDEFLKVKDHRNLKTILGYDVTWHYENPDGTMKISKDHHVHLLENQITETEKTVIAYFMKRFKKLTDRQYQTLSDQLGIQWNGQPAWTITELQQEASRDCISVKLIKDIKKMVGYPIDIVTAMTYAPLFGYEQTDNYDDRWGFLSTMDTLFLYANEIEREEKLAGVPANEAIQEYKNDQ